MLSHLSYQDRTSVQRAKHVLVAEYPASAIGELDPASGEKEPQSIQDSKSEAAMMANLALWLAQPSSTCFTSLFHALDLDVLGSPYKKPTILRLETRSPLFCHPDDLERKISIDQVVEAGELFNALRSIPRKNAIWTAVRSVWGALITPASDIRYSFYWIGLESMFGPDGNSGEITYKLSQRIAFFISKSKDQARETFRKTRDCYSTRSQIVHGRWEGQPKMNALMATTESIVRSALQRVLNEPELLQKFVSKERDRFLEDMVFSRYGELPHVGH